LVSPAFVFKWGIKKKLLLIELVLILCGRVTIVWDAMRILGGNALELPNRSKPSLPALTIDKDHVRQSLEDELTVNNLICCNLLLDGEFYTLYLDILKKSKSILHFIRATEEQLFSEYRAIQKVLRHFMHPSRLGSRISRLVLVRNILAHRIVPREKLGHIPEDKKKELEEALFKATKEVYTDVRKKVVSLSNKIQKSVSAFEGRRNIDLNTLSSTIVHFCRRCMRIVSLDRFRQRTCACGQKITRLSQVKQIPINHFNDRLIDFLEKNYWLEYGLDYLLKRKNFQTFVGYYVLGHSGVWHEIDNIAVSRGQNYRFFCECKNAEVKEKDIFVFSGKMIDIGCTRGYLFTTSEKVTDEIVRLGRAKNIDIVTGVLKRGTKSLLEEIKES